MQIVKIIGKVNSDIPIPLIRKCIPTNLPQMPQDAFFMQQSMTYEKAIKMLEKYKGKTFSARDSDVFMEINGNNVVGTWLDGGGSKSAYLATINGEDICVLLPNKIQNWQFALNEPQNTIILKKYGLLTNDYCKIVPVKVDGQTLPAIITKPYEKHSFRIFDKKNPNDKIGNYINVDEINSETYLNLIQDLIKDVKTMSKNGIKLSYDSYNIALENGKVRLYFNDLPYENGEMFDKNMEYSQLLRYNLLYAINALTYAFGPKAWRTNEYLKSISACGGETKLVDELLKSNILQ